MIGYLIFLFLLFLTDYTFQTEKPKLICFFVITTIFAGIRYGIGYDYWSYLGTLEDLSKNPNMTLRFEPLSALLMHFSAWTNVYLYFIITSLLTVGFYCWGIYKKGCDSFVAFLFYLSFPFLFFNHLSVTRQGVAHAIVFFAIMAFKEKRLTQLILILIAGLFHSSGFAGILIFLPWEKISTKWLTIMFLGSFFMGEILLAHIGNIPIKGLASYLANSSDIEGKRIKIFIYIVAAAFLYLRTKIRNDKEYNYYTALAILGASFFALFINNSTLAQRICLFFFGASIIAIPVSAKILNIHRFYFIGTFLLLFFLSIYVGSTPSRPQDEGIYAPRYPYRTIFDDCF